MGFITIYNSEGKAIRKEWQGTQENYERLEYVIPDMIYKIVDDGKL